MECQVRLARWIVLLFCTFGATGCADSGSAKTHKVSGKVTSADGAQIKGASVALTATGMGFQTAGVTGDNGSYQLTTFAENDGTPDGDYTVTITDANGTVLKLADGKNTTTVKTGANTLDFKVNAAPGSAKPAAAP